MSGPLRMIRHLGRPVTAAVAVGAGAVAWAAKTRHRSGTNPVTEDRSRVRDARPSDVGVVAREGETTGIHLPETKKELYELARERDIPGRSKMSKAELEKMLRASN